MTEQSGDFLDSGLPGATAAADESDPPTAAAPGEFSPYGVATAATNATTGWKAALRPTAWLAAGVVAGAVGVAAWHSSQTRSASSVNPAALQGQFPNGRFPNGQFPNGQFPNGQFPNGQAPNTAPGFGGTGSGGPGFGGPGAGGRTGEQHVSGTVTAISASSVTVRLTDGKTAPYAVIASSDIVKNGARVSLSAIKVGDAVLLHIYPSSGQTVVERLFAGDRSNPGAAAGTTKT
jgi:hypothetical protein